MSAFTCPNCGTHNDWIATGVRWCPGCGVLVVKGNATQNAVDTHTPELVAVARQTRAAPWPWPQSLFDAIRKFAGKG